MSDEQIEQVVLLDDAGRPIGVAAKATVHHANTPLHLAFSVYLAGPDGRYLLTRRALGKQTFPGVWTNSCCGHPAPGEDLADAIRRRVRQELGAAVTDLVCVLPDFRYRATAADGVVENEVCPVFTGRIAGDPVPDPAEVAQWAWIGGDELIRAAAAAPMVFSPWAVSQLPALATLLR